MKTNNYKLVALSNVIYAFCLLCVTLFLSCDKDNDERSGYFELTGNASQLEASAQGISETYTFKSSGKWKIEALRKEKWVKIEPAEGSGDGTFTLTVARNITPEDRSVVLTFMVDGKLQSNVFRIEQAASAGGGDVGDSYMFIEELSGRLTVPDVGLTERYIVRATGKWHIILSKEDADWVSIDPMEGIGDTPITFTVAKNIDPERTVDLLFYLEEVLQDNQISVDQEGVIPQGSGDLIFKEDFSWLNYGNEIFNQTTGETRISQWTTAELAKGWTGTIPPAGTTNNPTYASTYARPGFIKLGRTNYGGDIISPKLSDVQGTKNLIVTFKAVRYASGDHSLLKVGVNGPGTVSVSQFNVTNLASPNSNLEACRAAWQAPEATYSFTISGATSETQIWFFAGEYYISTDTGWPSNTNRIFLDDIVVTVQ